MAEKQEGRRVRMTKMLLKDSLIELMKEKPIHSITIKEICEGGDVNRSTFYRHYKTQYDLYDEIIQELVSDIVGIFENINKEEYNTVLYLTRVLEYIESKRETFLVVLSDKGNISVGEAYVKIITKVVDPKAVSELGLYIIQFIAAGMTSILWSWLSKENRRSAGEVAMVLNTLMKHGLRRAIDFSTNR